MATIQRRAYAEMFGPTTGDRGRLADTELIIEVERDFTIYGEEVKFGGGKTIRDGMGQSQRVNGPGAHEAVDCVPPVIKTCWFPGKPAANCNATLPPAPSEPSV